jgi:thiol:disulfide interchange protein
MSAYQSCKETFLCYTPAMSVGRISPIERKKSHSRKTKKRLQIKAAMLAARAAKKGTKKRAKRQ